jgi:hypothetical protein
MMRWLQGGLARGFLQTGRRHYPAPPRWWWVAWALACCAFWQQMACLWSCKLALGQSLAAGLIAQTCVSLLSTMRYAQPPSSITMVVGRLGIGVLSIQTASGMALVSR